MRTSDIYLLEKVYQNIRKPTKPYWCVVFDKNAKELYSFVEDSHLIVGLVKKLKGEYFPTELMSPEINKPQLAVISNGDGTKVIAVGLSKFEVKNEFDGVNWTECAGEQTWH